MQLYSYVNLIRFAAVSQLRQQIRNEIFTTEAITSVPEQIAALISGLDFHAILEGIKNLFINLL